MIIPFYLLSAASVIAADTRPAASMPVLVPIMPDPKRDHNSPAGTFSFGRLPGGVTQYVIGRGHYGEAREITFL